MVAWKFFSNLNTFLNTITNDTTINYSLVLFSKNGKNTNGYQRIVLTAVPNQSCGQDFLTKIEWRKCQTKFLGNALGILV